MLIRSLSLCVVYCFKALLGGIKVLLSPTLLFFPCCISESSSLESCWRFCDPTA